MKLNLPNIITLSRVVFLFLIVWLIYQDWTGAATSALILAIVASVSDWLDGYIARKYNLISAFGKIMDATIDKVMVLGLFVIFLHVGLLPLWTLPLVALIILRELIITFARFVSARKGIVLGADKAGKRKTIWQTTSICVLLGVPTFEVDMARIFNFDFGWWNDLVYLAGMGFFLLGFGLTLYSAVVYAPKYWQAFTAPYPDKEEKPPQDPILPSGEGLPPAKAAAAAVDPPESSEADR